MNINIILEEILLLFSAFYTSILIKIFRNILTQIILMRTTIETFILLWMLSLITMFSATR